MRAATRTKDALNYAMCDASVAQLPRTTSQTFDKLMECVGPYQYTNLPCRGYARGHASQRRAKLCDV